MEEIVRIGAIGSSHEPRMTAEEEAGLHGDDQSLVGVEGNRVNILERPQILLELIGEQQGSSEG